MADEPVDAAVAQSPGEDVDMADAAATDAPEKPDVKLDDLFADMDSDDEEFPSSKPPPQKGTQGSSSSNSGVATPTS